MAQILSYQFEGKEWPLLPPHIKNRLVSCSSCDNILNDIRAYCSVCGTKHGHWGPSNSNGQPCHICNEPSIMLCGQCNRPTCRDCSQSSGSGCISVSESGYMDTSRSQLFGHKEILTCQECLEDMQKLQDHYKTIFNVKGDYKYKDLDLCLWHNRNTVARCIVCNKPLCEICAYYKEKSFFGFNKKYVGPYCHQHLQEPKKWAIWAQLYST